MGSGYFDISNSSTIWAANVYLILNVASSRSFATRWVVQYSQTLTFAIEFGTIFIHA